MAISWAKSDLVRFCSKEKETCFLKTYSSIFRLFNGEGGKIRFGSFDRRTRRKRNSYCRNMAQASILNRYLSMKTGIMI